MDKICPMHGETASFTAPSVDYVKEPGCTCVVWPAKAPEKPIGADLSDVLIDVADGAMSAYHEPCGAVLLFTMTVHLDTLARVAAEHVCAEPEKGICGTLLHPTWAHDCKVTEANIKRYGTEG